MLFGIALNALAGSKKHFSPAGRTEFEAKLYKQTQSNENNLIF